MNNNYQHEMQVAIAAAKCAGAFLKEQFNAPKKVDEQSQHDIKLQLDKMSQNLITEQLQAEFPSYSLLGEEAYTGERNSEYEWIVDPIDGTVNYFYSIPWFCVSIALRHHDEIVLGVIYDPMMDECWHVIKGQTPYMNGRVMHCSPRTHLNEAMVFMGFGHSDGSYGKGAERFAQVASKVRKIRNNGSAALSLAYVACGRFDAYLENMISIWDIAAGVLLVESAGGKVDLAKNPNNAEQFGLVAWNGLIPIYDAFDSKD